MAFIFELRTERLRTQRTFHANWITFTLRQCQKLFAKKKKRTHTHTYTNRHIYICVCVYMCKRKSQQFENTLFSTYSDKLMKKLRNVSLVQQMCQIRQKSPISLMLAHSESEQSKSTLSLSLSPSCSLCLLRQSGAGARIVKSSCCCCHLHCVVACSKQHPLTGTNYNNKLGTKLTRNLSKDYSQAKSCCPHVPSLAHQVVTLLATASH